MNNTTNTTLTRQQLYDLVWSEPMTALAKRFSISDTGLRKICLKMNIPLPKAGHWTKLKFGKKEEKVALPKDDSGMSKVTISPVNQDLKEVYGRLSEQRDLQSQIEEEIKEYLIVPEHLTKPDKITLQTKDLLSGKIDYSHLTKSNINVLNVNVSKSTQSRALRIMDTLMKALRQRGHEMTFRNRECYVKIDEEEISIYMREKEKRVINEKSQYSWDTHVLIRTGLLCLKIAQKEFIDGKELLELQLSKIIAALEIKAGQEKKATIEREKWHAEYERKRLEQESAQKLKEKEVADFNTLIGEAERFHKASLIRNYIAAIEDKARDGRQEISAELIAWVDWALKKANWLDPSIQQEDELLKDCTYSGQIIKSSRTYI